MTSERSDFPDGRTPAYYSLHTSLGSCWWDNSRSADWLVLIADGQDQSARGKALDDSAPACYKCLNYALKQALDDADSGRRADRARDFA